MFFPLFLLPLGFAFRIRSGIGWPAQRSLPILIYFPEIKVGLSNHQITSLPVYLCAPPSLITFEPLGTFS
jgi:hypothetical protein